MPATACGTQALPVKISLTERHQRAGKALRAFRWGAVASWPDATYLHPTLSFATKAGKALRAFRWGTDVYHPNVVYLHPTLSFATKAGKALRAFRWGTDVYHPNVVYLHPTLSFANRVGESGKIIESCESFSNRNIRGAVACSYAKTRARQDAGHSLRDAGAPREDFPDGKAARPDPLTALCRPRCRPAAFSTTHAIRPRSPQRAWP